MRRTGDGLLLVDGRLPTVGEIHDPTAWGVHPASAGRHAAYVRRDRHHDIVAALQPGAFVVVTGPACAGTSRAAYEAVTATLPQHVLVMPQDRVSVGWAADVVAEHPRSVMWLDLDRLLGSRGLTMTSLARALGDRN